MKKLVGGVVVAVLALGVAAWIWVERNAKGSSVQVAGHSAIAVYQAATDVQPGRAPLAALPDSPAVETSVPLSPRGTAEFRVTSKLTMTPEVRAALAGYGARVISMVGGKGVMVEATPAVRAKIAADGRFEAVPVLPADKVQEHLAEMCAKAQATDKLEVTVEGLSAADAEAIKTYIAQAGGATKPSPCGEGIFRATLTPEMIRNLAERGDVRWLEHAPRFVFLNDMSIKANGANVEGVRTTARNLTGEGQIVCVADSGLDNGDVNTINLDFRGRILSLTKLGTENNLYDDKVSHGTHVAGTVLGSGANSNGKYKGMAPAAKLVFQSAGTGGDSLSFGTDTTYATMFNDAMSLGAYIHSDSWGGDGNGEYDTDCTSFDSYLWNHPRLLVVVAAGNDGSKGIKSVGTPATAKNVLAVGNTVSARPTATLPDGTLEVELGPTVNNLSPSSSRGPTTDGRNKPDLCAPGTAIVSVRGVNSTEPMWDGSAVYAPMTGTSMATPLVSGAAALTREWLATTRGITTPSSALMKAILAGGTETMTGKGGKCSNENWSTFSLPKTRPNTDTGYGRLNLTETLYPSGGRGVRLYDDIIVAHQGQTNITITTTSTADLDVMLAWIDYPADASASKTGTLVNDLDLTVTAGGTTYYGNGEGDSLNNMEAVRIPNLASGTTVTITITGYSISHPYTATQGAIALYVRGGFADATSSTYANSGTIANGVDSSGAVWRTGTQGTTTYSTKRHNAKEDDEDDDDDSIELGPVDADEAAWFSTDVTVPAAATNKYTGLEFSVFLPTNGIFEVRAGNKVLWSTTNSEHYVDKDFDWEDIEIDALPAGSYTLGFYYSGDAQCTDDDYVSVDDIWFGEDVDFDDEDSTSGTPAAVPHDWLCKYYPSASVAEYESLAKGKGANGLSVWESYVAGLDPTNSSSVFSATITMTNGIPVIGWTPELPAAEAEQRLYTIMAKPSLTNEWVAIGDNYDAPSEADRRTNCFFKVEVENW